MNEQNLKFIFGLKLSQLRQKKELSLKELSAVSGISASYLNEIEKGKKYPKADKIVAIAQALDTPYDELVSLKLQAELNPLSDLLKSGTLQDIPFELFGLEPSDIMELMSNAPMKFSALLDTFSKIARNYDMRVEHLLFAAMRSYQEMNNNYFEDLELQVESFIRKNPSFKGEQVGLHLIRDYVSQKLNYEIVEKDFTEHDGLDGVRSVYVDGKKPKIILNQRLISSQKSFILCKEIGYSILGLSERAPSLNVTHAETFDELLHNFKASYFAGALLLQRGELVSRLKEFFKMSQWDGKAFLAIMDDFRATPEMFFHRLTQILPKYFDIDQLYFLRFHHHLPTNHFRLTKELHFSRLHQPHGIGLNEHYCRRWITLILLKELAAMYQRGDSNYPIVGVQKSQFHKTDNEYFCISVARPLVLQSDTGSCVTLGFVMTEKFKRRVRFWSDDRIKLLIVNKTCERCGIMDCRDRVAPPLIFDKIQHQKKAAQSLQQLLEMYS